MLFIYFIFSDAYFSAEHSVITVGSVLRKIVHGLSGKSQTLVGFMTDWHQLVLLIRMATAVLLPCILLSLAFQGLEVEMVGIQGLALS